jgi:hypothetical protein
VSGISSDSTSPSGYLKHFEQKKISITNIKQKKLLINGSGQVSEKIFL